MDNNNREYSKDEIIDVRPEADKENPETPPESPRETADSRQYPPRPPVERPYGGYGRPDGRYYYGYRGYHSRRRGRAGLVLLAAFLFAGFLAFSAFNNAAVSPFYSMTQTTSSITLPDMYVLASESLFSTNVSYETASVAVSEDSSWLPLVLDYSVPAGKVTDITVKASVSSVRLSEAEGDEVIVKWYSSYDVNYQKVSADLDGWKLTIKEVFSNKVWMSHATSYVEIFLPKGSYGDINITTVSGSVLCVYDSANQDNPADKLTINSTSGSIRVNGLFGGGTTKLSSTSGNILLGQADSGEIKLSTTSGSIELESSVCEELNINSTSGSLTVSGVSADEAKLSSVSGTVRTSGLEAKTINASTVSGSIIIGEAWFEGLTIETVSGDTKLRNLLIDGCTLKTNTLSGSIDNRAGLDTNSGPRKINFSSVSGNLTIEK